MSVQNLLNQFFGSANTTGSSNNVAQGITDTIGKLGSSIPGGLASGAAAGGIMALLVSNKSARKFAGTAATYGGAAMLGGLAYKAFRNWQQQNNGSTINSQDESPVTADAFISNDPMPADFQLTLIKAMIAAARADGHIDSAEKQRIFQAVEQMDIPPESKGMLFNLLNQDISITEITLGISNIEQRSEIYLASCLVIDPDHHDEQAHLDKLATALGLPASLSQQLQWQALQAMSQQAA